MLIFKASYTEYRSLSINLPWTYQSWRLPKGLGLSPRAQEGNLEANPKNKDEGLRVLGVLDGSEAGFISQFITSL